MGRYETLIDVNAVLIGWAKEKGWLFTWTRARMATALHRGSSSTETGPRAKEPDPSKWQTDVAIKLRD